MASVLPFHLIPPFLVWVWITLLRNSRDPNLILFIGLWIWRYSRLFINLWFYMQYRPADLPAEPTVHPKDVTVVIPTVFDPITYASDLGETIETCLLNLPAEIIIVTDTEENTKTLRRLVAEIRCRLKGDSSDETCNVPIRIENCPVANKREQQAVGIRLAKTSLMLFIDDHVFLKPLFLNATVCAFENPYVGLCGTKKTVRREVPKAESPWGRYWVSFWNVMGALYLTRHNFEIRATNAADGGVFVVSGRAALVRTIIVQDEKFLSQYLNEMFLMGRLGPLGPDDDNFLTRWVTKYGWHIKIQDTHQATIETSLGRPDKFLKQCQRWARTTYRSNTCSLLTERTVWSRQPLTVWTAFIPSLSNLALFWDAGIVYAFTKSKLYLESNSSSKMLFCLWSWIYFAKVIKLMGYFRQHPRDFLLFFFPVPAYHIFAWSHSLIKLYAAVTFYNTGWTGRKLKNTTLSNVRQPTELSKLLDTRQPGARQISAFVFDVDGVLVKGKKPIAGARETIEMLQANHKPLALLTNGGGKTEQEHVDLIGKRLGVLLSKDQFVQSHTPYRDLVPKYRDENILVIGGAGSGIREVAGDYGFREVFTSSDFYAAFKGIHPFPEMNGPAHEKLADPLRVNLLRKGVKMAAILIWSSPRDWCLDLQVSLDRLRSDQSKLYVCNPDFEWATDYEEPRLAQGAFVTCLKALWKTTAGTKLKFEEFGKPTQATFEYGEKALIRYNDELNEKNGTNNQITTVYMIGDNPESDIQGCNTYISPSGMTWKSVLVETGVFAAGSVPTHTPTHIARSCQDAVQWALLQEEA